MDAQTTPNGNGIDLQQQIVADLAREMDQSRRKMPDILRASIYPFPSFLSDVVEEGNWKPKLASFGPYHKDEGDLNKFERYKTDFRNRFLKRIERTTSYSHLKALLLLKESEVRGCYSEDTSRMSSEDFIQMMLTDGSFIIELFRAEDLDNSLPWFNNLNTLTADLLKMANQLPFPFLEYLFHFSHGTGVHAPPRQNLKTKALRFFNQALGRPSDMVFPNMQQPKHLLDLFRSSLLPAAPPRNNSEAFLESIQRAEELCSAGIALRRKKAGSYLEIDFRKLQIPPYSLKIPPVPIDHLTTTILMNCFAMEQCLRGTSKDFTAYVRFMNCLLRQPEDVRLLCTANIITRIQPDGHQHVINLFDSVREKVHLNPRDIYLWKQYREIDSYYDSFRAYIWSKLARYDALTLVVSILAVTIALCSWLFRWLLQKK